MNDLFRYELLQTYICPNPTCQDLTLRTEYEKVLSIHFDEESGTGPHLNDILRDRTFAGNNLIGRKCGKCNNASDTHQMVQLGRCPDLLIVQLVRFKEDGSKKDTEIPFEETLDLTQYTQDGKSARYQLSSVVHHEAYDRLSPVVHHEAYGGKSTGGHYITVAKRPSGDWVELDDLRVSKADLGNAFHLREGFTPYILFWTRIAEETTYEKEAGTTVRESHMMEQTQHVSGVSGRVAGTSIENRQPHAKRSSTGTVRSRSQEGNTHTNGRGTQRTRKRVNTVKPLGAKTSGDSTTSRAHGDKSYTHASSNSSRRKTHSKERSR